MTRWLSLIAICLCVTVSITDKENYRQPYKFVAPYPLDMYTSPGTTPGDTTTNEPEISEDEDESAGVGRIGEPATADISLMSSSLNAPEPLPEPKSLVDNRSRSRKKVKEEEVEKKEEKKDFIENHKVEKNKLEPRAILNRQRIPPRPEDEYYYYYDDYYYDDYYPEKDPIRQEEKPVIPPTQSYPKNSPNTPNPPRTKETLKKETKPKKETYKEKKPVKPENENKKAGLNLEEREYNIQNTLNRLKGLKGNHVKKQGRPQTTLKKNPWEQFDLPPRKKPAPRPVPERKPLRKPVASRPQELYDYNYDAPVRPLRRQGGGGGVNPLALLVAPLAGIALLMAAAAVAINPVLVTVSLTGKRRKRGADTDEGITPELEEKIHEMQILERFMASVPDNMNYQHQVLSMYLSCSGYTEVGNSCMDRVVCEYADINSDIEPEERDVISIVLYNIMANEFVSAEFKERLRMAAKHGRDEGTCMVYECTELTDMKDNSL